METLERKYWIEGNTVMGNCHGCGSSVKFAEIIRMSKEDVENYKAIAVEGNKEFPLKYLLSGVFTFYASVLITSLLSGLSLHQIRETLLEILFYEGILAPVIGILWTVVIFRGESAAQKAREVILRKYGVEGKNPSTKFHTSFPWTMLILPEGEMMLLVE